MHGRLRKAQKIAELLALRPSDGRPVRVLEVGTGSGAIAQYFSELLNERGVVNAVDVLDQRVVSTGYQFDLVKSTALPFPDGMFDAVISNHVIEHVGATQDQRHHLHELKRVLRNDGRGYLAVPSRWQLIEPHYHLAFLSWLPHRMRSPYLRWRGRGFYYDCEPLGMYSLESCLQACGLVYENQFAQAVKAMIDAEHQPPIAAKLAALLPMPVLQMFRVTSPTHVYLFAKNRAALANV
ncbi:class I SAM-dependent methyltransferase [Pseudothauera nasutitermitis]|uniref:Class I SAM-dependent methyltransferase n=2 Tax=Pseudothauera nasutitermitis TaxID=2565930 RepID=A0A4S4AVQ2_9RHOO|nr:class I SAM-dependent methyltransferase [Pseudothauera nasutitermitis]